MRAEKTLSLFLFGTSTVMPMPSLLSVVIPAHNEAENLPLVCGELSAVLAESGVDWEAVVVDDGSTDSTWARIDGLTAGDARIRGVKLSRNFGHQAAILAGLHAARGEVVVCMDADLQHPPAVVPVLLDRWRQGAKVVSTQRRDPQGTSLFKRATSRLFYRLLSGLCGERIEAGTADFWLIDRAVVKELTQMNGTQIFFRGLIHWVGFPRAKVQYDADRRRSGETKYDLRRMLEFAFLGVTAMSVRPLRVGIVGGFCAAALGVVELGYVLYVACVLKTSVPGWASILVVLSLMFSFLFVYLGIVGEYLGRTFESVRGRPAFVVEATSEARPNSLRHQESMRRDVAAPSVAGREA